MVSFWDVFAGFTSKKWMRPECLRQAVGHVVWCSDSVSQRLKPKPRQQPKRQLKTQPQAGIQQPTPLSRCCRLDSTLRLPPLLPLASTFSMTFAALADYRRRTSSTGFAPRATSSRNGTRRSVSRTLARVCGNRQRRVRQARWVPLFRHLGRDRPKLCKTRHRDRPLTRKRQRHLHQMPIQLPGHRGGHPLLKSDG